MEEYTPKDYLVGKIVQEDQQFTVAGAKYQCWHEGDTGYYFHCCDSWRNSYCFHELGFSDADDVFVELFGDNFTTAPSGDSSPYAESLEDFTKVLAFLWEKEGLIPKRYVGAGKLGVALSSFHLHCLTTE